jgi:hypothetical protein
MTTIERSGLINYYSERASPAYWLSFFNLYSRSSINTQQREGFRQLRCLVDLSSNLELPH